MDCWARISVTLLLARNSTPRHGCEKCVFWRVKSQFLWKRTEASQSALTAAHCPHTRGAEPSTMESSIPRVGGVNPLAVDRLGHAVKSLPLLSWRPPWPRDATVHCPSQQRRHRAILPIARTGRLRLGLPALSSSSRPHYSLILFRKGLSMRARRLLLCPGYCRHVLAGFRLCMPGQIKVPSVGRVLQFISNSRRALCTNPGHSLVVNS